MPSRSFEGEGDDTEQTGHQLDVVVNPSYGRLNREKKLALYLFGPDNLTSRDRIDRPAPGQPAGSPHSD